MKKIIVIINGSGGVGKDSFVSYCSEAKSVMNISSVDNVKVAMELLCPTYKNGLEKQKDEVGEYWRAKLSELKIKSSEMDDGPYKIITGKIDEFLTNDVNDLLFIHIREPEEIAKVAKYTKCITMLFKNKNVKEITSNPADANVSNYDYDIIIDNSGTLEDLKDMSKIFLNDNF